MKPGLLASVTAIAAVICCSYMSVSQADPVSVLQLMRSSGCAGTMPAVQPLQHSRQLDRAAASWAAGAAPESAATQSGYPVRATVGLRVSGPDDSIIQELRGCSAVRWSIRRCRIWVSIAVVERHGC